MGCGSSGTSGRENRGNRGAEELYLPSTELRFNAGQMRRLNDDFLRGYENSDDLPTSSTSSNIESIVNRIVQRLLCGIGILDKRFASKFLITSEPMSTSIKLSKSFCYYVRLDVLSEPKIYEDDFEHQVRCVIEEDAVPQGYAKIRIVTDEPDKWEDLTDGDGYLRRDKLKFRFVELLATSASKNDLIGRPEDVDESYLCGCPGKIIDAELLHEILKNPVDEHVFFGTGSTGSSKFPDPRDLKIAIVEDAQCIKLRISGPKTTGDIAVVLLPTIAFSGWPKFTDLMSRIPLTHPDILIHQKAMTTGYYVVPVSPHRTIRCQQKIIWQIRLPAAECLYQTHYSERSVVSNIYHFLRTKVPALRKGDNGMCVVSGYDLKTLLWFRLEACGRVEQWDHRCVARHILTVLDTLVAALRTRHHRSYFFPRANIIMDAPRACRTMVSEDDYQNDLEIVQGYLYELFEKSMGGDSIVTGQAFQNTDADYWQNLESVMLHKWYRVLDAMDPKPWQFNYTRKQEAVGTANSSSAWHWLTEEMIPRSSNGLLAGDEISLDAAYLVSVVVEQALTIYRGAGLMKSSARKKRRRRCFASDVDKGTVVVGMRSEGRRRRSRDVAEDGLEPARRLLCDVYSDATKSTIDGDSDLVRFVLGRLHTAADVSPVGSRMSLCRKWRRGHPKLGQPLSHFLRQLYDVSHTTCWHLDEWRRRQSREELRSLGTFAKLLCRESMPPADLLLDAINKGWTWADKLMLTVVEFHEGVDIICTPGLGDVRRFNVSLPKPEPETFGPRSLGRAVDRQRYSVRANTVSNKFKTVKGTSFLDVDGAINEKKTASATDVIAYARLQRQSPMTSTIDLNRYKSNHRTLGNIVNALINLQKYTVLQEMCSVLPEDKQGPVLDDIRKMSKQRRAQRSHIDAVVDRTVAHRLVTAASADRGLTGVYRSTSELSAVDEEVAAATADGNDDFRRQIIYRAATGSLMATVRAARRKQSMSAAVVYNPAFYDAPVAYGAPGRPHVDATTADTSNPTCQPYLYMTSENGLKLRQRPSRSSSSSSSVEPNTTDG